jgi:single-strand DNA-binding protein
MNINRVILTGNLTRDPELRANGERSVCKLGIAVNGRRKNREGQWEDKPNYFRVTVFGSQGENCARYLKKGRPVAIDGRLEWSQWEPEAGQKRESIDIIAETVQFLGGRDDAGNGNGFSSSARAQETDVPIDTGDFERTSVSAGADEDIPF